MNTNLFGIYLKKTLDSNKYTIKEITVQPALHLLPSLAPFGDYSPQK